MARSVIWDDSYLVGVPAIDEQHKSLFDLYNRLLIAHTSGDATCVSPAFEAMASYLDVHFSTEEKFWRLDEEIYREHRKLHFDFVKYILQETADGNNLETLGALLDFLAAWLIEHIQTVDKIQFKQLQDKGLLAV